MCFDFATIPSSATYAIGVMVKTPGRSAVKTRLAQAIGVKKAEALFAAAITATASILQAAQAHLPILPYWIVAEADGLNDPLWRTFPVRYAGSGDLGTRLHRAYGALLNAHYGGAMLIGADTPQLDVRYLIQTLAALTKHQLVVGPARDGGFYLFAGNIPLPARVWKTVLYSRDDTLMQLCQQLPCMPYRLSLLTDFDTQESLLQALQEIPQNATSAQKYWQKMALSSLESHSI